MGRWKTEDGRPKTEDRRGVETKHVLSKTNKPVCSNGETACPGGVVSEPRIYGKMKDGRWNTKIDRGPISLLNRKDGILVLSRIMNKRSSIFNF